MTEDKRQPPDWEAIEKHYRAGIKSVRQIAEDYSVAHVTIIKRAKRLGWTRDLTEKIAQKAREIVAKQTIADARAAEKAAATKEATAPEVVAATTKEEERVAELNEAQTIAEYGFHIATIERQQRGDVSLGMSASRGQLEELSLLAMPDFRENLERLGELMDQSAPGKPDKANELYRYVISLAGRIKMAKEIAAAFGVYIPIQRKMFRMDDEADKGQTAVDALLAGVLASK